MDAAPRKIIEPRDPQERLKCISNANTSIEVDPHIAPTKYYRSGVDMIRMANVYYEEGNLENAYMLYIKYMTLFLEKIRQHPQFNTVPHSMKSKNQQTLREILPKAEKLKQMLLEQYTQEYEDCKKIKEKELQEIRKKQQQEEELKLKLRQTSRAAQSTTHWDTQVILPPKDIDSITYPESSIINAVEERPLPPVISKSVTDKTSSFIHTTKSVISQPVIDRSSKPSSISVNVPQQLKFRTVVIPASLSTRFLVLAGKNTLNNIETCGILAGILEQNQLIITHLIVPKQKGSSDSCNMINEEEIFDLQDQFGLITIGWIHTHPTQTAFLSSVDLHTHCPYQLLMPEAIAIVCAPKYNDTGIFILTPNYGLDFIANCRNSGFHPHPTDPPLFMTAAHIKIDPGSGVDIIDLRM